MDGNISAEGITADLESMAAAGIGGAHIFDVGQGVPAGKVEYNTPEWRALMVHAIRESKRLGLDMTMHNCAGWSSSGGPWVKQDDAMKRLMWTVGDSPEALKQPEANLGYYRDILTLEFPTPTGLTAPINDSLIGMGANPGQVDSVAWPVIPGLASKAGSGSSGMRYLRLGYTLTGSQNVASRDSGRGLEVDKLSAASLDRFFAGGLDPLFAELGPLAGSTLRTVLIDSYETGYNNWTPGMLDEFKKLRGYDATPYLPALCGFVVKDQPTTLGFLFDYRRTLADLWAKNYSVHFANKLAGRGIKLAIEPYGNGNMDPYTFAQPADLIMGEYWVGDSTINPSVKHSSSIAHLFGKKVVGAEGLTASPGQAGWRNQPRQWKPFADKAYTLGINRIIYHRFAHQPWTKGPLPGMTMGPWGSHVDRTNTIWSFMPSCNKYLSRCQYMLQSGTFAGDVLVFTGDDMPQNYLGEGQPLPTIPAGYDFDYCGPSMLSKLTVKNGRIRLANGAEYLLMALPTKGKMTIETFLKLKNLADQGAVIVGPTTTESPSLADRLDAGAAFIRMTGNWKNETIASALGRLKVAPDFSSEKGVSAIHRKLNGADVYFVATNTPYPRTVKCQFRVTGRIPEIWSPETGVAREASMWRSSPFGTDVTLQLGPDDSCFVVFRKTVGRRTHVEFVKAKLGESGARHVPILEILGATYGVLGQQGKTKDVTAILRSAADKNALRINASNSDMGGDPAVNIVKQLRVAYRFGGVEKTVVLNENEQLSIGALPDASSPPVFSIEPTPAGPILLAWQNDDFAWLLSPSKSGRTAVKNLPRPKLVDGPWYLRFPRGWDAPNYAEFKRLQSWTDSDDFGMKHFSGTVVYSKKLDIPKSMVANDRRVYLDLGDVRELARVHLNGKLVATLWKSPFRVDITNAAKVGSNDLVVEVTNLWVNRLIGDEQFPDDVGWNGDRLKGWPEWLVEGRPRPEPRRKTFTTWRHNFKDTPLLPSGLLGPVYLRSVAVVPLK